jgi:hypothetical protein
MIRASVIVMVVLTVLIAIGLRWREDRMAAQRPLARPAAGSPRSDAERFSTAWHVSRTPKRRNLATRCIVALADYTRAGLVMP